jgi:CHAT domain-containing protein/Flp pilus assembly protein TadD
LEQYKKALLLSGSVKDDQGQLMAAIRLGNQVRGQGVEALAFYQEGLRLARLLRDRANEAYVLDRLGLLALRSRQFEKAETLLTQSLQLSTQIKDFNGRGRANGDLGLLAKNRGQIEKALNYYQRSVEDARQTGELEIEARALCNIGEVHIGLGQPKLALAYFKIALSKVFNNSKSVVLKDVLTGMGAAWHELDDLTQALQSYQEALKLPLQEPDRAFILNRLGLVYRDRGDLPKAFAVLHEALRLARKSNDRKREAFVLADLAHLADVSEREEEAIRGFEQADRILDELGDDLSRVSVLYGRAEALRNSGHLEEAVDSVERSIDMAEDQRAELIDDTRRIEFFASRHRLYDLYIDLLIKDYQDPSAAFAAVERSRARTLLEDLAGDKTDGAFLTLGEIQREVVDSDSILLAYHLGDSRGFLWVVTKEKIAVLELSPRREIESAALNLWTRITNVRTRELEDAEAEVLEMSRLLFPPGIGDLAGKRLLISLDGPLNRVPFAALCNPEATKGCQPGDLRPLVLDHEIVGFPSASVLGQIRRKPALRYRYLAAILADPVFASNDTRILSNSGAGSSLEDSELGGISLGELERLPATRTEGETIFQLTAPGGSLKAYDFAATRETALSLTGGQYRILHFATHALTGDHPDVVGLMFSRFDREGKPKNGFLSAREIYGLNMPADLVVLSACRTALGQEMRGEGVLGLTRAFLHAGARRVLVTLWDTQDETTSGLMKVFYLRLLQDHLSPAAALRAAQISMVNRYAPRFWAGFILQGEPR